MKKIRTLVFVLFLFLPKIMISQDLVKERFDELNCKIYTNNKRMERECFGLINIDTNRNSFYQYMHYFDKEFNQIDTNDISPYLLSFNELDKLENLIFCNSKLLQLKNISKKYKKRVSDLSNYTYNYYRIYTAFAVQEQVYVFIYLVDFNLIEDSGHPIDYFLYQYFDLSKKPKMILIENYLKAKDKI